MIKRSKIIWRWISTILVILIVFVSFLFLIVIAERNSPYATINNFFDAIYYGFVTIAAVGYGDLVPVTIIGKILALILVVSSIALLGIFTGQITNEIRRFMENKKLGLYGTKMTNHFVMIGWDQFGMNVVKNVLPSGKQVAIITNNPDDIDLIYSSFDDNKVFVLFTDFNKIENFKLANIEQSKSVFINFQNDSHTLVQLINIKKHFKDLNYIVSLNNNELKDTFHAAGVTFSVSNNEVSAKLVASYIFEPDVANFTEDIMDNITEEGDFDLEEYKVIEDNPYINKDYFEVFVELKKRFNCILMGLSRNENNEFKLYKNPNKDIKIAINDYLILLVDGATKQHIEKCFKVKEGR